MDAPFAVVGYTITELLGFGTTGEVWRGRDDTSGEPVAIKRLWEPSGADFAAKLRDHDAAVRKAAGELDLHLVPVREVIAGVGGEVVVVAAYCGGGNLGTLLTRRGRLHPSEVVTLLAPLADLLASLHAAGFLHGDLSPTNVLFSADGRPMLTDVGLALALGERAADDSGFRDPAVVGGAVASAHSDVYGLAAVGYLALTGQPPKPSQPEEPLPSVRAVAAWVPAPLASLVDGALAAEPLSRPTADQLATAVLLACEAAPVRLVGPRRTPPPADASTTPTRPRRIPRPMLAVAVVGGLLVLPSVVGVGWAHLSRPAAAQLESQPAAAMPADPGPDGSSSSSPPDWTPVVARLEALRTEAYRRGDQRLLSQIYIPGAVGIGVTFDRDQIRVLDHRGLRLIGFTLTVERVQERLAGPTFVDLDVVDRSSAYRIVDATGDTLSYRPAGEHHYRMTIGRYAAQWMVKEIEPP